MRNEIIEVNNLLTEINSFSQGPVKLNQTILTRGQ